MCKLSVVKHSGLRVIVRLLYLLYLLPEHVVIDAIEDIEGPFKVYEINVIQRDEFHSSDCSTMILRVAIWSIHDLFFLKPICWSLKTNN